MSEKDAKNSLREIALMKVLNHPNLVNFYGHKSTLKELIIVLELCRGGSVFGLLKSTVSISLKQKLKIILDSSAALFHLHSKGGIHRDIASKNILLVEPVEDENSIIIAKVTDYGFSKIIDTAKSQATKTNCGTAQWTAPEVILADDPDDPTKYGLKADVYSFGVFMWEVFSRKIPYSDMKLSQAQIAPMVAYRNLRPKLSLLGSDTPDEIKYLIEKCFDKEPHIRPDMKQIHNTIEKLYE
jgi:serine/threonine protein kinase